METDAFLRTSHRLLKVTSVVVLPDASLDFTAVEEVHQELVNHALTALSVSKRSFLTSISEPLCHRDAMPLKSKESKTFHEVMDNTDCKHNDNGCQVTEI